MTLQGADAVGDGGGGDAEFVARVGEALVADGSLEEAEGLCRAIREGVPRPNTYLHIIKFSSQHPLIK